MNHNSNTPASGNTSYVYILTNPSFKEDWVKIGKSSRPVDVPSKELDNTAVWFYSIIQLVCWVLYWIIVLFISFNFKINFNYICHLLILKRTEFED